ncbi:MAG: transposase [Woeseia sp.]
MARLVVPGYPHHLTQRGVRKQRTFFEEADYLNYIALLIEHKAKAGVETWAYCLMPNHVHLVAVPSQPKSLAKMLGVTHHRYARQINARHGWQGHLWQERFHSCVMDEVHLIATVRYVELNPVRAGLCTHAEDWRWSSVHAHLNDEPDGLVSIAPMRERISDWRRYLSEDTGVEFDTLRKCTRTGRPAGGEMFINTLEELTGRRLRRRKPGRR